MRKALFGILMAATIATPLAAQDTGGDGLTERYRRLGERNQQRYEQRMERREERQAERPSPVFEQRSSEERAARQQERTERRQERFEQRGDVGVSAEERGGFRRGFDDRQAQRAAEAQAQAQAQAQIQAQAEARQQQWGGRGERGNWQDRRGDQRDALQRQIEQTREASRRSAEGLSPHYQQQAAENQRRYEERLRDQYRDQYRDRRGDRRDWQRNRGDWGGWRNDWRQDSRYDWQRYRYRNRSIFSPGYYYSPYRNRGYSRFSIGVILDGGFYSSRYWITDPWQYRLPEPYPGTRWVRYYNDVLLVDVYTGEVVDVIYDFFW